MKKGIYLVESGDNVHLKQIACDQYGEIKSKIEARKKLAKLHVQISDLQEKLYAEGKQSLLIILQAMDTGGKDGAVENIFTGINPAGVQVTSFKAPSADEIAHDFLWRVHKMTPSKGMIGVWNRSHYEDVLIVKVHHLIDKKTCENRYDDINAFEKILSNNGVKIIKFFLHISKEEQKNRLQSRLDNKEKNWKFNPGDIEERKLWDNYQDAYEQALGACSTLWAPWYIVPSDHKWHRDLVITEVILETLQNMNPKIPKVKFDPKKIIIE
jgi:PPK2 family polyphosphate:nucleotide phosphotransferase